jgi:hypothetical protein
MRLLKEREVDRDMYEALSFSLRDDEDLLVALDGMLKQDACDVERTAEVDRLAGENEERARSRAAAAEHELSMARHELQLAHQQRITTKKLHAAAKQREEQEARIVKALRLHTSRTRKGVLEWAGAKGFDSEQLPELQLMAAGGLKKLLDAHRRAHPAEQETAMSISEAEAI